MDEIIERFSSSRKAERDGSCEWQMPRHDFVAALSGGINAVRKELAEIVSWLVDGFALIVHGHALVAARVFSMVATASSPCRVSW